MAIDHDLPLEQVLVHLGLPREHVTLHVPHGQWPRVGAVGTHHLDTFQSITLHLDALGTIPPPGYHVFQVCGRANVRRAFDGSMHTDGCQDSYYEQQHRAHETARRQLR